MTNLQRIATSVCLAALLTTFGESTSRAQPTCGPEDASGGDWPVHGRDPMNSRHQEAENRIGPLEAITLAPAWSYRTGAGLDNFPVTDLNGTPIIAHGCVYVVTSSGAVIALNADTGESVWRQQI